MGSNFIKKTIVPFFICFILLNIVIGSVARSIRDNRPATNSDIQNMTEFTNQIRQTFFDELDLSINSIDIRQLNISQEEYAETYRKYVELQDEDIKNMAKENSIITPELAHNIRIQRFYTYHATQNDTFPDNTLIFPMELHETLSGSIEINRASLRILMPSVIPTNKKSLNIKIYQETIKNISKEFITEKTFEIETIRHRWIDFDVEQSIENSIINNLSSIKLILECDICSNYDIKLYSYLNILISIDTDITDTVQPKLLQRIKRTTSDHRKLQLRSRKSRQDRNRPYCNNQNTTKCCRYPLDVTFKDLESFEFILEPKSYDAGFCKGHCPVRYNPANKHALIQSLVWKKDRRAPKPCCAPKKYSSLQIIYLDKNNKMKITKWPKMSVIDCACI